MIVSSISHSLFKQRKSNLSGWKLETFKIEVQQIPLFLSVLVAERAERKRGT